MSTPASARYKSCVSPLKKSVLVSFVLPAKSREQMFAEEVYHLAEKRGFMLDYEQQDCFAAEQFIQAQSLSTVTKPLQSIQRVKGDHEM